MKRFLVFGWDQHYPYGGFNDLIGEYDDFEDCEARIDEGGWARYEIVDLTTGDRITSYEIKSKNFSTIKDRLNGKATS